MVVNPTIHAAPEDVAAATVQCNALLYVFAQMTASITTLQLYMKARMMIQMHEESLTARQPFYVDLLILGYSLKSYTFL